MTSIPTAASPPRAPLTARSTPALVVLYAVLIVIVGTLGFAAVQKTFAASADLVHYLTAAAELTVIGLLVALHRRWFAWVGVSVLFTAFAGYTTFLLVRGESSCGCFGDLETPPIFTLSLDLGLAALAAIVALSLAGRASIVGGMLTLAGASAAVGAGIGVITHDPLPDTFHGDRAGLLLTAPSLAAIADADLTEPDSLVYLYDPDSSAGAETLELMRGDAAAHADDPSVRVIMMSIDDAEAEAGVPAWAWAKLPAAILYRGGRVVERYVPDTMPDPQILRAQRPVGPIAQVLALPDYADITYATDDLPVYLIYVYNPDCPICLEHLAVMNAYTEDHPNDPTAVVVPVSMHAIEETLSIPLWAWPGVPTSYVVKRGRVIGQTAGADLIPNPYQIREDLMMGRPLRVPDAGAPSVAP